jgi:sulfate-transporting ATPase
MKLVDPNITDDEMNEILEIIEKLNGQMEAGNLWDLVQVVSRVRVVSRAMDSLRVPAGDAQTATLSGGQKRQMALCKLLFCNHGMFLLDEPTNYLDGGKLLLLSGLEAWYTLVGCVVTFIV